MTRGGRRWLGVVMALAMAAAAFSGCGRASPNRQANAHSPDSRGAPATGPGIDDLAQALSSARLATAKYATDLGAAQADGYRVITPMMPDMGVHYLNRAITGFNIQKPPILVYVTRNGVIQLGALEWVFATQPPKPPLPGATYGTFDAACHYTDGQVIRNDQNERSSCALNHPITSAPLLFEHGPLVTLHVWLWYPNPEGIYHSTNPLIRPYN